jgi:hypothetical protein
MLFAGVQNVISIGISGCLTKGGKFDAYKTSWLFADTSAEAIKRAKEWARSFDPLPKDAWLQVAMSGSDICNLRPGEF